jgi:hypothetical protein
MATNLFVSYDHEDHAQVNGFRAIRLNPNHDLDFHDHSLKEPVRDIRGLPIKVPPADPRSRPVRDEIIAKFNRASKLLVLIGDQTHASAWVEWEVKAFFDLKNPVSSGSTRNRIRGMWLKGSEGGRLPASLVSHGLPPLSWDLDALYRWLAENPNG